MIKNTLIVSMICLAGCSTYSNTNIGNNDCNKDTPMEINKAAALEYREARANGKVKSAFINIVGMDFCKDEVCTRYHPARYDFVERDFNMPNKKGIYTLTATKNLQDPNCFGMPEEIDGVKYCYAATKNENNEIKSRYKFTMVNAPDYRVMKVDDLKERVQVIKMSECNIPESQRNKGIGFF